MSLGITSGVCDWTVMKYVMLARGVRVLPYDKRSVLSVCLKANRAKDIFHVIFNFSPELPQSLISRRVNF